MLDGLFWDDKWQAVRSRADPLTDGSMILVRGYEILPGQDPRDPRYYRPESYAIIEANFDFCIAFSSVLQIEKGKVLPLNVDDDGFVTREINEIGSMTVDWINGLVSGTGTTRFRDIEHQTICLCFFEAAMLHVPAGKTRRYKRLTERGYAFAGNKISYSDDVISKLRSGRLNQGGTPLPNFGQSSND